MGKWSLDDKPNGGFVGGVSPHLYDCPVGNLFVAESTKCLLAKRDEVFNYDLAHFLKDRLLECPDEELQKFLEDDGFLVRRESGCFVLEMEGTRITVSRARAVEVLIIYIVGPIE